MYQSASIAGKLSGSDRLGLGTALTAKATPGWARPGQAARWAAAAPKPLPEWVSGPELTEADKPLMDPTEQILDVALAGAAMLADVWQAKTKEAVDGLINKYLQPKSADIEALLNRYYSRDFEYYFNCEEQLKFRDHSTREGFIFTKLRADPAGRINGGFAQQAALTSVQRELVEETYDSHRESYLNHS